MCGDLPFNLFGCSKTRIPRMAEPCLDIPITLSDILLCKSICRALEGSTDSASAHVLRSNSVSQASAARFELVMMRSTRYSYNWTTVISASPVIFSAFYFVYLLQCDASRWGIHPQRVFAGSFYFDGQCVPRCPGDTMQRPEGDGTLTTICL